MPEAPVVSHDAPANAIRLPAADPCIGERGAFVGMHGFGASAPGPAVYKPFSVTAEAVVAAANGALK